MRQILALQDRWVAEQQSLSSRAALIAATIANVHRSRKKAYSVQDFMPKIKKKQTCEDHLRVAEMMTAALGGKLCRD